MSLNRDAAKRCSLGQTLMGLVFVAPIGCLAISGCGESQQFSKLSVSSKVNGREQLTTKVAPVKKGVRLPNSKNPAAPTTVSRDGGK